MAVIGGAAKESALAQMGEGSVACAEAKFKGREVARRSLSKVQRKSLSGVESEIGCSPGGVLAHLRRTISWRVVLEDEEVGTAGATGRVVARAAERVAANTVSAKKQRRFVAGWWCKGGSGCG